jgi:ubiquinone/menaquinone biosynthesis C-methylase UbiE
LADEAVKHVVERTTDERWDRPVPEGRAAFVKGEASWLPLRDGRFSVACIRGSIMGSFPFLPRSQKTLPGLRRVLRPGGRPPPAAE